MGRVREKWEARQITPWAYLKWSNGGTFASLAGAIARTQDPAVFVARTGLPLELALLCEVLINAGIAFEDDAAAPMGFVMRGDDAIWSFGLEWVDAIAVGQDVSDAVPRILPVFLKQVLSDDFAASETISPEVRAAAEDILDLWACEARGEAVPPKAWRTVRASALRAAEGNCDPVGCAAAGLVESLPWQSRGIAAEFPAIWQKFLVSHRQTLAARLMTNQDRIAWGALLTA
ncbi:MAG: hypothetical protein RBR34_09685, partial [Rhodospirillaceae bacterium]|nr:hypothetical protein [Rhodospirillaceae bacterium]